MHTAYHPYNLTENEVIELSEDESWHLVKVARINLEEKVKVINGNGQIAVALIQKNHPKNTLLKIEEVLNFPKPNVYLNLVVAPTKVADRLEWMMEKAVEFGLSELSIILTERTERKKVNTERLQKIALAAAKQSKNPWITKINEPVNFNTFIKNKHEGISYIAHCENNKERILFKNIEKNYRINVLIGPEGDFTENEISLALQNDFIPVILTQNILRAETAALYVTALLAE